MSSYHASFFNNLINSNGRRFKSPQGSIEIHFGAHSRACNPGSPKTRCTAPGRQQLGPLRRQVRDKSLARRGRWHTPS
jgi:hypothetical protein